MKKREERFEWIAVGITLLILFLFPSTTLAADWYVDTGVGSDANPGTFGAPFKTLNRAMEVLDAGDTLHIGPGTYNETITIFADSDNVTLIGDFNGADSSNVILNAGGVRQIDGVWHFPTGITAQGCSNLRIENMTVKRGFRNIGLWNVDSGVLRNLCLIEGEGFGGACVQGGSHNRIENLYVTTIGYSILVENSPYSILINNWINRRISVTDCDYAQFIGNHLVDGNFGPYTLLDIISSDSVLIRGTECHQSGFKAISLKDCRYGVVEENHLERCGGGAFAIGVTNCEEMILQRNSIIDSFYAVVMESCTGIDLQDNSITHLNQNYDGVLLKEGNTNINIRRNLLDGCRRFGVKILSGNSNINLVQNTIINTIENPYLNIDGYGVWVESGVSDLVVEYNNFSDNERAHIKNNGSYVNIWKNYYGTVDASLIARYMFDFSADSWMPFRLSRIDTGAGADLTAPAVVSGVYVYRYGGAVITWDAVETDEDGNPLTDLAGYRVYRFSDTAELYGGTAVLCGTAGPEALLFYDGAYTGETEYYYVVTAFDNQTPFENESWYSSAAVWTNPPVRFVSSIDDNCFVVSAGFGATGPVAAEMRRFRDETLLSNRFGRALTTLYYTHGPGAASMIQTDGGRLAARLILAPVVGLTFLLNHGLGLLLLSAGGFSFFWIQRSRAQS